MRKPQFPILLLLISFASVGAVLFTPALPSIQTFFGLTIGQAQLTVTVYLWGYALGQLPYGPLANRFGRKPALYGGLSLAVIGALLCGLSSFFDSFALLVFSRFIQALGASVGLKITFTMIAEVYDQSQATRKIAHVMSAFAIMPGLAIALGGFLTEWLNWQSCFYFLCLFGLFVLLYSTQLPETAQSLDRQALKIPAVLRGYATQFKNSQLVMSGLMMGCRTSIIYLFAAKAPFIGIQLLGLTPESFGVYNLIPLVGMLLGALFAGSIAGRFSLFKLLFSGVVISLLSAGIMVFFFLLEKLTLWSLFLPMFLIYFSTSIIFANLSSFGLANVSNKSNGSAVFNFINLSFTALILLIMESLHFQSAFLMPMSFAFLFLLMLVLCFLLRKQVT